MEIYDKLIEKIVYNVVTNDNWLDKQFTLFKPNLNEYKLNIKLKRVSEIDENISVTFGVTLINYRNLNDVINKYETLNINKDIYLQFMRDEKIRDIAVTQEDKIRQSLSDYLEFDSDDLFKSKFNLVRIFGGAIRDIIAEQPINDVDILCGSKAMSYIESVLEQNGYHYMEMLNGKDLQEMYSEIHIINEPHTWVKGKKIVQLIRPSNWKVSSSSNSFPKIDSSLYEEGFRDLISNVDFSCCGVSYDGETLYEDYPNAIVHCQNKVFSVNMRAKMYSQKRALHRKIKLETRGWKEIQDSDSLNRDLKINALGLETKHESVYGC
jgi:hypothetical protein